MVSELLNTSTSLLLQILSICLSIVKYFRIISSIVSRQYFSSPNGQTRNIGFIHRRIMAKKCYTKKRRSGFSATILCRSDRRHLKVVGGGISGEMFYVPPAGSIRGRALTDLE